MAPIHGCHKCFMDFGFGGFNFGDFGEDFFNAGKKPIKAESAKKEEKKAAKKEDAKKSSGKASKGFDCEVSLPVTVFARNFSEKIGENGTMKLSEICGKLIEMGYEQMNIGGMELVYLKDMNIVYVADSTLTASVGTLQAFEEESGKLTVVDGHLKCELSPENFPDKSFDEVTLDDISDYFGKINPQYEGCRVYLDFDNNLVYPVFDRAVNDLTEDTISVCVNGSFVETETEDGKVASVIKKLAGEMGGAAAYLYKSKENFFLSYSKNKEKAYTKSTAAVQSSKKSVEKKYPLPMTLYVVTWNMSYDLTPEMFDGKEKVTKDEITKKMASVEKMFADTSRRVDYVYSEERKTMSCMFISGKKGAYTAAAAEDMYDSPAHTGVCKLIRSAKELEAVRKLDMFVGLFCEMAEHFKILALPHGNFYGYFGKEKECCTVKRVEWERKLPKMSRHVLDKIVDFFRRQLPNEGAVRILYNRKTGEFFTVFAEGKATRTSIEYDYTTAEPLMCMPDVIQVCEIHSHNTMSAYFSPQDDADEQYAGVFGVIGNLDMETPSIKFRAGLDGVFTEIAVSELFE